MHRMLTLVAVFITLGCAEEIPDVSGVWKGDTRLVVDGEDKAIPLEVTLTQSENRIAGTIRWGDEDHSITSADIDGREVFLKSEWEEGTYMLRGLIADDVYKGRFTYTYVNDPEPFPAKFELTRQ